MKGAKIILTEAHVQDAIRRYIGARLSSTIKVGEVQIGSGWGRPFVAEVTLK